MNYNLFLTLILMTLSVACTKTHQETEPQKDLAKLCETANSFAWSNYEDPTSLVYEFNKKISQNIKTTEVGNLIQAISQSDDKWALLQKGAKDLGANNYQCEKLEYFYTDQLQKLNAKINPVMRDQSEGSNN